MSLILSIETATPICSVAVYDDENLLGVQSLYIDKSHSGLLTPSLGSLVSYCGYKLQDLEAIAVSSGPGSYTGLRIGVSTAKGLCFSLGVPLISVNTLEAMAYGINRHNSQAALLCPMLDARRMEVYALVTDHELNILQPTSAVIVENDSFEIYLQNNRMIFFGDGSFKCKNVIKNENAIFLDNKAVDARNVGYLAYQKFKKQSFEDVAYFEPFYLKDFKITKPKTK